MNSVDIVNVQTAGALQVEANMQKHLVIICILETKNVINTWYLKSFNIFALAFTTSEILTLTLFTLKSRSMWWGITFVMVSVAGKYQTNSIEIAGCIFTLAVAVSDLLTFKMFNSQKVGYGYIVQLSQCFPSMLR